LKIWDVDMWVVSVKPREEEPEHWDHWSTETVVADTLEVAVQKAIAEVEEGSSFFKVEARKAELIREVDIE